MLRNLQDSQTPQTNEDAVTSMMVLSMSSLVMSLKNLRTLDDAAKYDESSGSIVTGLLASNARLEDGIFIPCDNCSPLPLVWLRPI